MSLRVIRYGFITFLLVTSGWFVACGDTEHVPNPFEVPLAEQAQEKVFVVGTGLFLIDPAATVGLVSVVTHEGRDDLRVSGPIESGVPGSGAVATGGYVYVSNPDAGTVTALSAATDEIEGVVRVGIQPGNIAVDPSRQFVVVANEGNSGDTRPDSISIIDANPDTTTFLQEIAQIQVEDGADDLAFSTGRARAFVSNRLAGTVSVIDMDPANVTSFLSLTTSVSVGPAPGVMTYSRMSGHVYAILNFPTAGESIAIIDADNLGTPTLVQGIPRGTAVGALPQAIFMQLSRDGLFIWVSLRGGIGVIDVLTDTVVARLNVAGFSPGHLVEDESSRLFVSGGDGTNTVLVIDVSIPASPREVSRIGVGLAGVDRTLALSVDATRVYVPNSGQASGSVSVIDVATLSVVATIPTDGAHPNAIVSIDVTCIEAPVMDDFGGHGHDPVDHAP